MLCHLAALSGFIIPIPFANFIVPAAIWLAKREKDPFIDHHGRESLNFQVTLLTFFIVSIIFIPFLIGIAMLIAVYIYGVFRVIIAAIRANDGEYYWYPRTFRLFN